MSLLSPHFQFIYPWRSYQSRFLNEFDTHLADNHLHVVAPPGSGKTVLGLEMIQRLNQKTLILAPTLTIRNQWYSRMLECFVEDEDAVSTSMDIKNPATLTFSTYQSLHSFFKNDLNLSSELFVSFFQDHQIKTFVLDEAHHLKNEWWKPLYCLKQLPQRTLVALTATPPYDSELSEIKKYFDLCGPIDMEISVPELVREENLCPHQDYIYFSEPDAAQIKYIINYREQIMNFVGELKENTAFIDFIKRHPFYSETKNQVEEIYSHPEIFSSLLIYLNAVGIKIDSSKTKLLGIQAKKVTFPSLTYEWIETLLQPFLIDNREQFLEDETLLSSLERKLRKIGALEKNRINLVGEKNLHRSLAQSPSKLKSIVEIVQIESEQLQSNLRMVILTDYIRKEFLDVQHKTNIEDINKIGVVSIFQHIRNAIKTNSRFPLKKERIGVLTGSVILIHNSIVDDLSELISEENFKQELLWETEYVIIKPNSTGSKLMVHAITQLFEEGKIEVLVGTKSLLGEGWDAPAINTLILASFVGSFVMSNQMRGRAIRTNPLQPDKVANIWHIACVDPTSETGGVDVELLLRRFEAFSGVSLEGEPSIKNGAGRLNISKEIKEVSALNTKMTALSSKRKLVAERWSEAIESGNTLVRELKLDYPDTISAKAIKKLYYRDALAYVLAELSVLFTITFTELFLKNLVTILTKGFAYFVYTILFGIAMVLLPKTYKAIVLYIKYGRRDKELQQIALALKEAMIEHGLITETDRKINVVVEQFNDGSLSCYLAHANAKEGVQFVNYLQEIIDPVENPRYVVSQTNWLRRQFGFSNHYSIPKVFGERKKEALDYYRIWQRYNGNAELIFTRTLEGRKLLLKARFQSYQDEHKMKSKKALIWR